ARRRGRRCDRPRDPSRRRRLHRLHRLRAPRAGRGRRRRGGGLLRPARGARSRMTATLLTQGTFFFPGPTEVRAEVLAAMTRPLIAHRGKACEALFASIQASLKPIFRTTRPVYVSSSSATGLMEAAVRCAPEGRVLSI